MYVYVCMYLFIFHGSKRLVPTQILDDTQNKWVVAVIWEGNMHREETGGWILSVYFIPFLFLNPLNTIQKWNKI